MLLAKSINPSAPTLFKAQLSPYSKTMKAKAKAANKPSSPTAKASGNGNGHRRNSSLPAEPIFTVPKKLEWDLSLPALSVGIRFAETRLSDLICQNDCQALEFKGFGKNFVTKHGFSPDAFVQMAFQAAYYGLYGAPHSYMLSFIC